MKNGKNTGSTKQDVQECFRVQKLPCENKIRAAENTRRKSQMQKVQEKIV